MAIKGPATIVRVCDHCGNEKEYSLHGQGPFLQGWVMIGEISAMPSYDVCPTCVAELNITDVLWRLMERKTDGNAT